MRDYAQISPRFWTGDTGKQLRGHVEAQLVAFYLMSAPGSHMIGMYPLELPTLCHHTGLTIEGARKGLARLSEVDFARFDEASEVVWVPEMAHFQIEPTMTRGDKRVKGVEKELENYRKSRFFNEFIEKYREDFCLQIEPEPSHPTQGPSKPLRSQEQEQEQDQEQEQTTSAAGASAPRAIVVLPEEPKPEAISKPTWIAYRDAYRERYGVEPVRNKTVNSKLKQFVERIGAEEAPSVAAFFVQHNAAKYVSNGHSVGLMLYDCEPLRTQWATGKQITGTHARQVERTQANADGWASLLKEKPGGMV